MYDAGSNNNGRLDPGESVDLTSRLVNMGGADLVNLNTTIHSSDPYVTITDNSGSFGTLHVDSIKENTSDPYTLSASSSAPNGHHAEFTFIAAADGGFVDTAYFNLCIGQDVPTDTGRYYAYYVGGPHPHCPTFDWFAIDTTQSVNVGTSLDLLDNQNATVNLPFTFTYYGMNYNQISVGSNGFVALGYTNDVDWSNTGIPSADGPPAMIAAFWSDLDPGNTGAPSDIYWYYDQTNNRFIIEYFQVEHWPSGSNETFEVILYDPAHYPTPTGDGEILIQYLVAPQHNIGTIGIENNTETVGIQYYYNDDYNQWAIPVTADFAIKYTTHDPTPGINEYDDPSQVSQLQLQINPNPFNSNTKIRYSILDTGSLIRNPNIDIYDATGRLVKSLNPGSSIENPASEVLWDGTDQTDRKVPEGIYFARLEAADAQATAKIILVR